MQQGLSCGNYGQAWVAPEGRIPFLYAWALLMWPGSPGVVDAKSLPACPSEQECSAGTAGTNLNVALLYPRPLKGTAEESGMILTFPP